MFMSPPERSGIESAFVREPVTQPYQNSRVQDLPEVIVRDLNHYGICVLDDFLGEERAHKVLGEVMTMYAEGKFTDGQLVNPLPGDVRDQRRIRGDKISWISGQEPGCANIAYLINQVDLVITQANKMQNNGQLGKYCIRERTKAMVACYPGLGTRYVKHVDNPDGDGRCITATYYLNPHWDSDKNGGMLRVYPQNMPVLDIAPQFDRILFFWSDRRNPHAVQPAHRTRYAITLWYHDATERERALKRQMEEERRLKGSFGGGQ